MKACKIYLVRHGQTYYNVEKRLGGDSRLTLKGIQHAKEVTKILKKIEIKSIYSSLLKMSIQTAKIIHKSHPTIPFIKMKEINELSAGDFDSLKYSEFEKRYKNLFETRKKDKYHWKFPNGESYETATARIKPFLDKLIEKEGNYILVGHQGMNRIILGYLLNLSRKQIPYLVIPSDVIFEIDLNKFKKVYCIKDGLRKKCTDFEAF